MKLSEVFPSMPCRSTFSQHGKSMLLHNHIEYFKKKSEFAQILRLDPEMDEGGPEFDQDEISFGGAT